MASRFDALAAEWDQVPARAQSGAAVAAAIVAAVPLAADWHALDYGAGTGLVTLRLLDHVAGVTAVDSSEGMLNVLREKVAAAGLTQVDCRLADLEAEPWPGPTVDLVVSSLTLHHLRDVPLVLGRLVDALRPGGWMAVADLDLEDGSFHGEGRDDVYHLGFARTHVAAWLAAAGCSQVAVSDACRIAKPGADGTVREYSVFLAVGRRI